MALTTTNRRVGSRTYWRPSDVKLSSVSSYDDDVWTFDGRTLGQGRAKERRIDWKSYGIGSTKITDAECKCLLEELKCLMWTLHFDRREGVRIKEGTTQRLSSSLLDLVPWMMTNHYTSMSMITNEASWNYLNWFRENHDKLSLDGRNQRRATFATAWQSLHILTLAYEQSSAMEERGYVPMPSAPYDGRRAFDLATRELGYAKGQRIAPLPDELSVPTLREAGRWVADRSDDILRLHRAWMEASPLGAHPSQHHGRKIAESFVFSVDPDTNQPWASFDGDLKRVDPGYGTTTVTRLLAQPLRLVRDLIAACLITIQGMTGMRSSDLASIQTSLDDDNGLPPCIERRISLDGLTEMFLLNGVEQKRSHEAHSWVLGARLDQTDDYPLPVKAVIVLHRLLGAYRRVSGISSLIVVFTRSNSMAIDADRVGTLTSQWMNNAQRGFITNYVKLPTTTHKRDGSNAGYQFRSAQWRVTFAIFVIRTNKRALGPLSKHFNHVDALMTEHGYIGNDPELLHLVDDARINLATNTLYQLISDEATFAGGLEAHLRSTCGDLRTELKGMSRDAGLKVIGGIVTEHDLRLHFTDYGACGVAVTPALARCHQLAGSDSSQHVLPNFGIRRPSVCSGCRNFLIAAEHVEYWRTRVKQLEKFKQNPRRGSPWRMTRELALARQFVRTLDEGHDDVANE